MFKQNVMLVIHNFGKLKSLANNAKIRSSLIFFIIPFTKVYKAMHICIYLKSVRVLSY